MVDKKEKIEDLEAELKLKTTQLKDQEARLNGGFSPTAKRTVIAVDKELDNLAKVLELKKIELAKCGPLRPKYIFENDSRWQELQREFRSEEIAEFTKRIEAVEKQKKQCLEEKSKLEGRISYINKALGKKLPESAKKETKTAA